MAVLRVAIAVLALLLAQAPPPESAGTPDAKSAFEAGMAARRSGDREKAVALFRTAIDADPRFVEAHEQFIEAQDGGPELKAAYERWAAAHPDNPVYEWALARLAGTEWNAAERHLQRAIAIAPAFARAYADLALVAELRGDNEKRVAYLKQASELKPSDASYFFEYAYAMTSIDRAEAVSLLLRVAERFPASDRGAQALYWAAYDTSDVWAKLVVYERLRTQFPPETFSWSESAMPDMFDALVGVDPPKARALAADMEKRITAISERKRWHDLGAYAAALAESSALRARGDGRGAVRRLDGVTTPQTLDHVPLALARAAALEAAGDPAAAYASLVDVAVDAPSDALLLDLARLGGILKKTQDTVRAELRARRDLGAVPARPFTLPAYPDRTNVSLADFQGRVVLLSFWYPSCGPCRGEFPVLQRVLDKYADRGFTVLAINVVPDEKDLVVPYLTKNRFGFRALEATGEWADQQYGVRGVPANVLVDARGRIIVKPAVVRSPRERRTLELQIESLLR